MLSSSIQHMSAKRIQYRYVDVGRGEFQPKQRPGSPDGQMQIQGSDPRPFLYSYVCQFVLPGQKLE